MQWRQVLRVLYSSTERFSYRKPADNTSRKYTRNCCSNIFYTVLKTYYITVSIIVSFCFLNLKITYFLRYSLAHDKRIPLYIAYTYIYYYYEKGSRWSQVTHFCYYKSQYEERWLICGYGIYQGKVYKSVSVWHQWP